jgi:hypothetical protein
MATLEEIGRALKNAHAAGDVAAATKLAQAYQREKERANKGAAGQRGGMVEEGTISREEYMRQRGPVNEAFDPIPQPSRVYEDLPAEAVALGSVALLPKGTRRVTGSGSVFGVPKKPDFKAPLDLDTPQAIGVPERISRAQSVALGTQSLNPVRGVVEAAVEDVQQQQPGTQRAEFDRALTQSLRDNPMSTRAGQVAALTAGGGAQLGAKAVTVAPKLVSPAVASRFAGPGLAAQTGRFAGRGAVLAGVGATENYAYNVLAEAPNQYMEAGLPAPTVGERVDYAGSQILSPGGLIAAGAGPVGSTLYRGGRAAVAGTKNLLTSGGRSALAPGATAAAQGGTPIANLFTPSNVQRNVAAITPTTPSKRGRTAREEAIDLLLAKGLDADQTEKLTRLLSYDNYTSVDEMLFELANADIDQLAVAAARVGGEAKKTFREAFRARAAEMPERIRVQLRDAMALSGDELEDFASQMAAKADEATADGYTAAYAQQVSDDTWAKMWDRLSVSPDTAAAISAGARLARNSYRGNPAQLEVARQLDELASALDSPGTVPPKLSTHALDYLDRGFGSLIAGQKKNNPAFAASLIEIQKAVRSAGLDADTGLNVPRGVYSQYKAASRALDFGAKAAVRNVPLRELKKQFSTSLKDADEVFEDIVGEGRSVVDQALVMGWLRGVEDKIETATNPGSLIRDIYGSERQRAKLLEMMPQETDVMTAGLKADQTKRIKALVGSELGAEDYKFGFTLGSGARAEGRAAVPSLFERQRQMLANQARVSGNSVTGEVTEAIAAQGGLARAADYAARAVMNPAEAAKNAALWAVANAPVFRPAIFKPEVNRELGRILTTRGRDELLAVIGEIRARQAATARGAGTPPASGAAPPTPPTGGKPGGKLGTRAADAAAIAAVAGAPPAQAETGKGSAELKTANERLNTATQRLAGVDNKITQLEEELQLLERAASQDPTVDAKRVQLILDARGFDLGPKGADGKIGKDTRAAIAGNIKKIENDVETQRAEREKARGEVAASRKSVTQAEIRAIQARAEPSPLATTATLAGQLGAIAGGLYLAKRGRAGAVLKSGPAAQAAAAKANALLSSKPATKALSGPGSINEQAANINAFWKMGGAGEKVPFKTAGTGRWSARSGAVEPAKLFEPKWFQQYRSNDALYMTVAGLDAIGSRVGINKLNEEINKTNTEITQFEADGNVAGAERAIQHKARLEGLRTAAEIAEKLGYGYLAGRSLSPLMPYAKVAPDVKAAEAQRARLLQQMRGTSAKAKSPPPKKPAAPAQNQGQGIP